MLPLRLMPEPDDRSDLPSLISGARSGDRGAFARLAELVQRRVRGWAVSFTHDADDADDVTQDVLILVHRRLPQFEGKSRFSTWLYTITRNVALDRRRTARRRERRLETMDAPADSVETPQKFDESTLTALILRYFDELPARQREVFELSDIQGLSAPEVAARLGMKAVTVRANLFKARRTIRQR
ncbi:MAG TPA: sigma-70 family RNA polymerase sigma factor, partial [Gemmatimonadaceae bacterium]|nr:sigma-70 family RNA polymerase sigma factor [Gemmatimonadaceae bacterium]